MAMNPTRTTLGQALSRWQRGIARAVLLTGALAGMAVLLAPLAAQAQIAFRNAAFSWRKLNARIPRRRRRGARAVESPTGYCCDGASRVSAGRDRRHGPEHLSQARLGISYRSAQGWYGSMRWR